MKILRILFVFTFLTQIGFAQTKRNFDQQTLTWIRYYNILPLTEKWALHSEFDNRSFINPVHENLFVIRIQGRYRATKLVDLGVDLLILMSILKIRTLILIIPFPNIEFSRILL